jgi:tetratricopeptide (TPR) repeat protein
LDEALRILDEAEKQLGDGVELRLARARFWAKREGPAGIAELTKLERNLERLSPSHQLQLLTALVTIYARLGDRWEAQRLGNELATKQLAKDLNVRLLLFDIAMEHGLEPEIVRLLEEIREIEGPEGTLWRFGKVQYLIWHAQMEGAHSEFQAANDLLVEATELLKTIAVRRPTWSRVPLGQAMIEDVGQKFTEKSKRNFARANQFYLQAFKGGERNPEVIRRASECLIERQQWKEAYEVLNKLPDLLTSDLQRLAEVSFKQDKSDRALELAKKAVQDQPNNPLAHLWLGELWWALEKVQNAVDEFHRAEALADKRPDVWLAVVFHWVHAGKSVPAAADQFKIKAEAALEKARAEIPPEQAPLALGRCYEMMASLDKAKEQYWVDKAKEQFEAALKAKPADVATLRSVATFLLQTGKSEEATVLLGKLIDLKAQSPADADWARNMLAIVLASKGDYQQSQRALKLTTETPEGLRAQVLILMAQKVHRKQYAKDAIANLERIESPTPDDRFLLAKLYENVNQWPKARDLMVLLLDSSRDSPGYLDYFVHFVKSSLAHQEPDAAAWLQKLKKRPEAAGTPGFAEMETRYFAAQKEPDKAIKAAIGYLDGENAKQPDRNLRLRWAAELLDNLSQAFPAEMRFPGTAEKWYRELLASKSDQILLLVSFVGRQGRIQEALDLCERERAWQVCSAEEVGNVCMNVLHAGPAGKENTERVERWLESAIAKQPKTSAALTVCLADLQDLQGRYREAEESYRQALEKDPRNVVALNNLAWLLALREGQGEEALNLLNRAMEIAGPLPALLDTQGVAYMAIGKADQAIKVLEQAMEDEPAAAFSFHLAEARKMQHNSMGAKEAFAKATESLGLKPERLHPLERNAYEQLLAEYKLAGN